MAQLSVFQNEILTQSPTELIERPKVKRTDGLNHKIFVPSGKTRDDQVPPHPWHIHVQYM